MATKTPVVAIVSPSQTSYSETFIEAHKKFLKGDILYYYGSNENKKLEGYGVLRSGSGERFYRLMRFLKREKYTWYLEKLIEGSFKKHKVDVVFAEYGDTAFPYLNIIQKLNLPLIVHFHGYDASIEKFIKKFGNYKRIFDVASFVVVVSRKMYNDLLEMGCPEEKLIYNVSGPRVEFLDVAPKYSKQQFIAAGRFVDKKAPYYLILSFRMLVQDFPETKLIMAGEGRLLEMCKNLVKYHGLEKNVIFPGVISAEELRKYMEESLAFVQHSVTAQNGDTEGTPLTILEASAAGLPVVSTFHGGIPDIIENNITGLLVDEHDIAGMADKMLLLLKEPGKARSMGQAGKERIRSHFTLDRHIHGLNSLISKAILEKHQ